MRNADHTPQSGRGRNTAKLSALMTRASELARKGLFDEAIAGIREAMAVSPRNARCYVELANIYRAQRRLEDAAEAVRRATELDPDDLSVHEQLLQTLVELGRYDEAVCAARKLLVRHPRSLYARDVLGIAYLQQGRIDAALDVAHDLIRLAPTDPLHHFKKAVLLQQKGEVAQAMSAFARALEMDPEGEVGDGARHAISALDSYQLRQILSLAMDDSVFRAKLTLDPESASRERGFALSPSGVNALRQIDLTTIPGSPNGSFHRYH